LWPAGSGSNRAALKACRQPARIGRVPFWAAREVLDLTGVGQHALESLGLQPVKRPFPVAPVASITTAGTCLDRSQSASASTPRLVVPKLRASAARRTGLLSEGNGSSPPSPPCRCRCRTPGPGTAARPSLLPRVPHLYLPSQTAKRSRLGNRGRAEETDPRARSNNERPLSNRLPASGCPAASTAPIEKRRHGRYHPPFSRRYGVARSDTRGCPENAGRPTATRRPAGACPAPATCPPTPQQPRPRKTPSPSACGEATVRSLLDT
jgi:hypothetical protein